MLIISMCCIYMQENALVYAPVALEPYFLGSFKNYFEE